LGIRLGWVCWILDFWGGDIFFLFEIFFFVWRFFFSLENFFFAGDFFLEEEKYFSVLFLNNKIFSKS